MGHSVFRDLELNKTWWLTAKIALLLALLTGGEISLRADSMPSSPAETLSGEKLMFPNALAGRAAVCIFGFSKEAGDKTKEWMKAFSQDDLNAWSVANLENAPSLVRGMIRSSMRKGTPEPLHAHSLLMTRDLNRWKQVTGAKDEHVPLMVIFDASGRIAWTHEGLFSSESYREAKNQLEAAGRIASNP
jgi:hypothetical protein